MPQSRYMRFALKGWRKILLKKYQCLWKAPMAAIFSFVWGHEPDTKEPPPFSKLKTCQVSFPQVIWCPHCVESNRMLRRRKPVGQAPKLSSLLKTLLSNVFFAFGVFLILLAWINISDSNFYFVWLENNATFMRNWLI